MNIPNNAYVPGSADVSVGIAENKADEDVGAPRQPTPLANRITIKWSFPWFKRMNALRCF